MSDLYFLVFVSSRVRFEPILLTYAFPRSIWSQLAYILYREGRLVTFFNNISDDSDLMLYKIHISCSISPNLPSPHRSIIFFLSAVYHGLYKLERAVFPSLYAYRRSESEAKEFAYKRFSSCDGSKDRPVRWRHICRDLAV